MSPIASKMKKISPTISRELKCVERTINSGSFCSANAVSIKPATSTRTNGSSWIDPPLNREK